MSTPRHASTGRISARFAALAKQDRPGFVPYLTAGYPTPAHTRELLSGLADAGADVIELGIPFSDPMADGPTIQRSCQGALDAGATTDDALEALADFRRVSEAPVVLFSYLNPLIARGIGSFLQDALDAGADGILATDLPLGADLELEARLTESRLDFVRLIAPTTPGLRALEIARASQGFVYYVARTGVTGVRAALPEELTQAATGIRSMSPCPVAVGFGVSTPEQARQVGAAADAAVVGSALVDRLDKEGVAGALALAQELREGLDAAR